jgi:predicted dehydrogenase
VARAMSKDSVKIGLVGAGAIAQITHLPTYESLPGAEVVALCDPQKGKGTQLADRHGIDFVCTDHRGLLERAEVDAVDICTPNAFHARIAVDALQAGKHVLVEKPIATSAADALRMVEAARSSGKVLMVASTARFRHDSLSLKTYLERNELGELFYAKTGWLRSRRRWSELDWRFDRKISGGGVLMDSGIQVLDVALWLLGFPEPERVLASTHTPAGRKVEDSAVALVRFKGGLTLTLEVNWSMLMDEDFAYLNVYGSEGGALLNPLRIHREMHGELLNVTPAHVDRPRSVFKDSYRRAIEHFVRCVRGQEEVMSPGEEALRVLQLMEAIYRSASEGHEVVME